jgi:hypothetical protein
VLGRRCRGGTGQSSTARRGRLAVVEPRVAHGLVPVASSLSRILSAPPRHSVTSSPVSSTWMPPGQVPSPRGREEAVDLGAGCRRSRGSCARRRRERVAVHRVARPHHRVPGVAHGPQDRRQRRPRSSSAPMRLISVSRPGMRSGLSALAQLEHLVGGGRGADLAADRVADAAEELDVRAVELAGALADPEHVRRAVVPVAGERVLPGERLLVAEHQRLVARVERRPREVRLVSVSTPQARMKRSARSISSASCS